MVLMKNPQFLPNQAQTLAILHNHEMVILTKFHINWMKIVDFSLIPYFRTSPIFYFSPSTYTLLYYLVVHFIYWDLYLCSKVEKYFLCWHDPSLAYPMKTPFVFTEHKMEHACFKKRKQLSRDTKT